MGGSSFPETATIICMLTIVDVIPSASATVAPCMHATVLHTTWCGRYDRASRSKSVASCTCFAVKSGREAAWSILFGAAPGGTVTFIVRLWGQMPPDGDPTMGRCGDPSGAGGAAGRGGVLGGAFGS